MSSSKKRKVELAENCESAYNDEQCDTKAVDINIIHLDADWARVLPAEKQAVYRDLSKIKETDPDLLQFIAKSVCIARDHFSHTRDPVYEILKTWSTTTASEPARFWAIQQAVVKARDYGHSKQMEEEEEADKKSAEQHDNANTTNNVVSSSTASTASTVSGTGAQAQVKKNTQQQRKKAKK